MHGHRSSTVVVTAGPGVLQGVVQQVGDELAEPALVAAGAEVRFGDRVKALTAGGVVAHGPRRADVVAVG